MCTGSVCRNVNTFGIMYGVGREGNESELLLPLLWWPKKMLPGIVLNGLVNGLCVDVEGHERYKSIEQMFRGGVERLQRQELQDAKRDIKPYCEASCTSSAGAGAALPYAYEDTRMRAYDDVWLHVCEMLSSEKQGENGCAHAANASPSEANTDPLPALHSKVKPLWQPCHRAGFPDPRARTIVVCAEEKSKTRVVELFGKCTESESDDRIPPKPRASFSGLLECVQKWCREDLKAIQTADSGTISTELKASWTDFFSCKSVRRSKGVGALPEDPGRLRKSISWMKLQREQPKCVTTTGASADSSRQEEETNQDAELISQLQQLDEEIECFLESITEFIAADKCHREALGGAYHQQDRWELMWELPEKDDSEDGEHGENEEEENMEQNARKKKAAKKEEIADVELDPLDLGDQVDPSVAPEQQAQESRSDTPSTSSSYSCVSAASDCPHVGRQGPPLQLCCPVRVKFERGAGVPLSDPLKRFCIFSYRSQVRMHRTNAKEDAAAGPWEGPAWLTAGRCRQLPSRWIGRGPPPAPADRPSALKPVEPAEREASLRVNKWPAGGRSASTEMTQKTKQKRRNRVDFQRHQE
eukprot:g16840.t1